MSDKKIVQETKLKCGIVMPISGLDGYSTNHWQDVKEILYEAIELAGFEVSLVSEADDVGIIQKRIIQNLYDNPIVVCDVSGKNPNVMFELGIRLAFDKPTIIVKDNITSYSFDTAPIEHLEYPRDLRFNSIVSFKDDLSDKIKGTYESSINDENYTTFLKHFGQFKIPTLDTAKVSSDEYILDELRSLRNSFLEFQSRSLPGTETTVKGRIQQKRNLCLRNCTGDQLSKIVELLVQKNLVSNYKVLAKGNAHYHVEILSPEDFNRAEILATSKAILPLSRYM